MGAGANILTLKEATKFHNIQKRLLLGGHHYGLHEYFLTKPQGLMAYILQNVAKFSLTALQYNTSPSCK